MNNTINNIEKKYLKDEILTKKEWDSYKFFKRSFSLKYKLPNNFLENINPDNQSIGFLDNYCETIVNTKLNRKVFKINFSIGIIRLILNVILLILDISLLAVQDKLDDLILELFLPIFVVFALTLLCWIINSSFYWISWAGDSMFNNYKLHVEYYRCKFAIISNKKNEVNSIEHIRKYFKIILYKFVDEKKIEFLKKQIVTNQNKNYSKFYVVFVTYWFVFVDLIFVIGSFLIFILTALHTFNML